jgi:hypothetical protein
MIKKKRCACRQGQLPPTQQQGMSKDPAQPAAAAAAPPATCTRHSMQHVLLQGQVAAAARTRPCCLLLAAAHGCSLLDILGALYRLLAAWLWFGVLREADRVKRIAEEGWDRFAPVSETNKP